MRRLPDHSTFERAASRYAGDLHAAAMRYTRNTADAEDLVQETLLRALAAWGQFTPDTNCRAWLLRILTNSYIDEYRRRCRDQRRGMDLAEGLVSWFQYPAACDPEQALLDHLLGDEIHEALAALPDEYQMVVVLADLQGLTYRQIAERLSCPLGTVMSRLHRGRKLLERPLAGYAQARGITRCQAVAA